jgi:hypothetical protein
LAVRIGLKPRELSGGLTLRLAEARQDGIKI